MKKKAERRTPNVERRGEGKTHQRAGFRGNLRRSLLILSSFCILHPSFCISAPPSTDPAMDSILGLSQKAPATQPAASQPAAGGPLKNDADQDQGGQGRPGELVMSDGTTIKGKIATTPEKPIRVWVEKEKDYEDLPIDQIASAEATVVWERDEKEWNFKESGSDIKVYSGKTYPARQTQYKFTLTDGTVIEGDVAAPLYVTTDDGKTATYVLYKRDKGKIGQRLKDLPYVKSVTFGKLTQKGVGREE